MDNPNISWEMLLFGAIGAFVAVSMAYGFFRIMINVEYLETLRRHREREGFIPHSSGPVPMKDSENERNRTGKAMTKPKKQPSRKIPRGGGRKKRG